MTELEQLARETQQRRPVYRPRRKIPIGKIIGITFALACFTLVGYIIIKDYNDRAAIAANEAEIERKHLSDAAYKTIMQRPRESKLGKELQESSPEGN